MFHYDCPEMSVTSQSQVTLLLDGVTPQRAEPLAVTSKPPSLDLGFPGISLAKPYKHLLVL
jgi:hypothetical protein